MYFIKGSAVHLRYQTWIVLSDSVHIMWQTQLPGIGGLMLVFQGCCLLWQNLVFIQDLPLALPFASK